MGKELMFVVVFLVLVAGVLAADGWGDINEAADVFVNDSGSNSDSSYEEGVYSPSLNNDYQEGDGTFFTPAFYIALILIVLVLLVVMVVIWFFIRGPQNEWEKKAPVSSVGKIVKS